MRTLQSRYGLLLLGVGLGFVSWFIDSCADWIWFAKSETFWGVLLPDEPVEVWMRFLVMVICGILGYLAQQAFNRQRALMIALERSNVELAAAKEAGLDIARIEKDLASPEINDTIKENMKLAEDMGLNGTPSYVIGKQIVVGAVGLDGLKEKIGIARCGKATC